MECNLYIRIYIEMCISIFLHMCIYMFVYTVCLCAFMRMSLSLSLSLSGSFSQYAAFARKPGLSAVHVVCFRFSWLWASWLSGFTRFRFQAVSNITGITSEVCYSVVWEEAFWEEAFSLKPAVHFGFVAPWSPQNPRLWWPENPQHLLNPKPP